ncbi:sterol 26-hydroxylase, mitochondrial [Apteryx mantelli]|uniref:Sterol 26-hydroxylase, mitochondrial n=1 Tax=Apteryx mantelli TaxID=2696672 RepID=A0ABM4EPQ8_9AVES
MAGPSGGARRLPLPLPPRLRPLLPPPPPPLSPGPRRGAGGSAAAAAAAAGPARLKGPGELPGPGLLRTFVWLFLRGYLLHTHRLQLMSRRIYGPIWKSTFGHYENINIGSPEVLEQLLRQEGKYPMRSDMALWKEHRDTRRLPYGPFTEEGERWYRLRQVLNKRLLKPSEAALYAGAIGEVVSDLMVRLRDERSRSPSGVLVCDVANLLYRFALEGISYILFETRIGCLRRQVPAETQHFIDSINLMFKNSIFATVLPRWTRKVLPFWGRYLDSWDTIFAFGKTLIDRKMEELEGQVERGKEVSGYLSYLLASGRLSLEEVYGSVAELLLAGVDTTSNTLSWALYHLSRDLGIQEALYQELTAVVPPDRVPGAEDIPKMPLLRAVIKETLRIYPVVPTNARVFWEKDIVIGDYLFPKNTLFVLAHYAMSHDETHFPEPERFLPQRWLRGYGSPHHPFSSIPFGYGVRACVGRRIAELEMHLALARIIQAFEVRPDPRGVEVTSVSRIVLVADKPINLEFVARPAAP